MKRILLLASVLFIFFRINGIECSELVSGELNSNAGAMGREVIFIDSSLPDVDALLNEWKGKDTVIIGKDGDPWVKMTNALSARKSVRAVHLITHGRPGELWISGEKYDVNTLPAYELRSWRNILEQEADVLLYGCEVGEGVKGGVSGQASFHDRR